MPPEPDPPRNPPNAAAVLRRLSRWPGVKRRGRGRRGGSVLAAPCAGPEPSLLPPIPAVELTDPGGQPPTPPPRTPAKNQPRRTTDSAAFAAPSLRNEESRHAGGEDAEREQQHRPSGSGCAPSPRRAPGRRRSRRRSRRAAGASTRASARSPPRPRGRARARPPPAGPAAAQDQRRQGDAAEQDNRGDDGHGTDASGSTSGPGRAGTVRR